MVEKTLNILMIDYPDQDQDLDLDPDLDQDLDIDPDIDIDQDLDPDQDQDQDLDPDPDIDQDLYCNLRVFIIYLRIPKLSIIADETYHTLLGNAWASFQFFSLKAPVS